MDCLGVENKTREAGKALGNDICDLATQIRREYLVRRAQIMTLQVKKGGEKKVSLFEGERCLMETRKRYLRTIFVANAMSSHVKIHQGASIAVLNQYCLRYQ